MVLSRRFAIVACLLLLASCAAKEAGPGRDRGDQPAPRRERHDDTGRGSTASPTPLRDPAPRPASPRRPGSEATSPAGGRPISTSISLRPQTGCPPGPAAQRRLATRQLVPEGAHPRATATIRGTEEYNLALGDRRAQACRRYLLDLGGVPADVLSTITYGESRPIESRTDRGSLGKEPAWPLPSARRAAMTAALRRRRRVAPAPPQRGVVRLVPTSARSSRSRPTSTRSSAKSTTSSGARRTPRAGSSRCARPAGRKASARPRPDLNQAIETLRGEIASLKSQIQSLGAQEAALRREARAVPARTQPAPPTRAGEVPAPTG